VRVLLVEDDPAMAALMAKSLGDEGFTVEPATTCKAALAAGAERSFDVLIVDRRLPDGDGLEIVRGLRSRGLGTPILVVSALSALEDRVQGLDAGADDYLKKPFAFPELVARLHALVRRGRVPMPRILRAGDVELDPGMRRASAAGKKLELTQREFALLQLLLRARGGTLSRSRIGEEVWEQELEPASNVIDVYVRRLRKKLEDAGSATTIETVRGEGYLLRGANDEGA
jgi:DNA-binding response OmpR family regulator